MKYGMYSDSELPSGDYRCPSWDPMPDGKKNVVVLGCSHTYGVGHDDETHWVAHLSKHNTDRLRYWNLGQPGASGDKVVRILYGSQKVIYPSIVIVCWPFWSRRERLGEHAEDLVSYDSVLKDEDEHTDKNNFLKNVFLVEKFAEQNQCKTFHCFAQDSYHEHMPGLNVLDKYTIKNCWPYWDKFEQRQQHKEPDLASDGEHYGTSHHKRFAELFIDRFKNKLK
jgi:hypothetical protein|tara:strand:+ start:600 stop:1271 length:672 start_codon:yes stop_codon:yes gene_type:complete